MPDGSSTPGPELIARVRREVFLVSFGGDVRVLGWAFDRFAGSLEDVFIERGGMLYREGDRADEHFFVVSGEILLSRAGLAPRRMGNRSVVGVVDMMLDRPHVRTATAIVASHLLRIKAEDWWSLLEDRIELAHRILVNTAEEAHRLQRGSPTVGADAAAPGLLAARGPSSVIARILLLREVPLLARARVQALTTLAEAASEVEVAAGAVLFARGEMRERLAVVASGQLIASPEDATASVPFGPGALVGGPGALARSAEYEVRASPAAQARALVLSIEEYFDAMEEHFSLVRSALRALGEYRERFTGP